MFTTPGRLRHGVDTNAVDAAAVARIKGDLAMCAVLRRAAAREHALPDEPIPLALDAVTPEVDRALAQRARAAARFAEGRLGPSSSVASRRSPEASSPPRTASRTTRRSPTTTTPTDPAESAAAIARDLADDLRGELVDHPGFWAVLDALWPLRTPERLLARLLESPERLAAVVDGPRRWRRRGEAMDPAVTADLASLHRADGAACTVSDAPLLDELAELLGPLPGRAAARRAERATTTTTTTTWPARTPTSCAHRLRHRRHARRALRGRAGRRRRRPGRGEPRVDLRPIWSSTRPRSCPRWTGTS